MTPGETVAAAASLGVRAGLDTQWREAFAAVPREAFPHAPASPLTMARSLLALPDDARTVLQVGAALGGYHAAILAHRYGPQSVTVVEANVRRAQEVEQALREAGYPVTVAASDSLDCVPDRGPYDAIVATRALTRVPYAWVEQCPAGRIIAPYSTPWTGGAYVVLDVRYRKAEGGFYCLDGERAHPPGAWTAVTEAGRARLSDLPPSAVMREHAAGWAVGLIEPTFSYDKRGGGDTAQVAVWDGADSWALVDWEPGGLGTWTVREGGTRSLWRDVEAAYVKWLRWLSPSPDRFGMTVGREQTQVWLDYPGNPV